MTANTHALAEYGAAENRFTSGDHDIVRRAVDRLPKRERNIVRLRFWEDLSTVEIAAAMRLDYDSVAACLSRAMGRLMLECLADPAFSRNARESGVA